MRVALGGGIDALPAIVAQERGFFVQERLVASVWSITSEEAVGISLSAGTTDFAVVPQRTFLLMAAARLPVSVVATSNWDTQLEMIVPAGVAFDSVQDLQGKRIIIDDRSDTLPLLVRLLNHSEVSLSNVAVTALPGPRIAEAFAEGQADVVLAPRYLTQPMVEAEDATRAITEGVRGVIDLLERPPLHERMLGAVLRCGNRAGRRRARARDPPRRFAVAAGGRSERRREASHTSSSAAGRAFRARAPRRYRLPPAPRAPGC